MLGNYILKSWRIYIISTGHAAPRRSRLEPKTKGVSNEATQDVETTNKKMVNFMYKYAAED